MTRKHYILIAKTIAFRYQHANAAGRAVLDLVISDLVIAFAGENPRFDRDRFDAACKA